MRPIPTLAEAEDAAADGLADLLLRGLAARGRPQPAEARPALVAVARELLRGPLTEDCSRKLGGYCMKAPTHPTLRAIGWLGVKLVELSYTSRNPDRATAEARAAIDGLRRCLGEPSQDSGPRSATRPGQPVLPAGSGAAPGEGQT